MKDPSTRPLRDISRTLRVAAIALALVLVSWLLKDILLLVFAAVLIACTLRGASNTVDRRTGIGSGGSLLTVVAGLAVVFGAVLWWRGPEIADQMVEIGNKLASQAELSWQNLARSAWGSFVEDRLRHAGQEVTRGLTGYISGVASSTLGIGGSLIVVIATAAFLAISPTLYVNGFLSLFDPGWRPHGARVLREIDRTLRLWFMGQLVDMVVVALLIGIGLFMLEVKLALTLALLAGLLNFVPYVGALTGAIPAVLVAFSQSPALGLWVTGLFAIVQTLEGYVIAPLIQNRTVSLPPALTVISQTVLGTLFGVLGLVLATPLMAAALVAVRMIYVEKLIEHNDETRT